MPETRFFKIVRSGVVLVSNFLWSPTIKGLENLPDKGPFIVAPNHRSNIDTFLIVLTSKKRFRFMGKDSLWKFSLWGKVLSSLGGFPVKRGTVDREALQKSLKLLAEDEIVVVFPEGERRKGDKIDDIFDGSAFVALKINCPIVPVGIAGSELAMPPGSKLPRRKPVALVIGKPILPQEAIGNTTRQKTKNLTSQLQSRLQELLDEATLLLDKKD